MEIAEYSGPLTRVQRSLICSTASPIDAVTTGPPSSKSWSVIKCNRPSLGHKLAAQPAEDQSHNLLWIVGAHQLDIFIL
jgi:hypothetical protein